MKKKLLICFCVMSIIMTGACSCSDEKHITQEQAEYIANDLIPGGATFVKTEIADDLKDIDYIFKDSNEVTFAITSALIKGKMSVRYECSVHDNYAKAVLAHNQESILQLLDDYGLREYLVYDTFSSGWIFFDVYVGTPEEHRDMLKRFANVAAEIDALLNIIYDTEYEEKLGDVYFSYGHLTIPNIHISYYKTIENSDRDRSLVDSATIEFSVSDDTRWTSDALYKAMTEELVKLEIAE